jgi:hypothetical protein
MKMLRSLTGISALCVSLLLNSCGGSGDPTDTCGGSLPKQQVYLITGYNTSMVRYEKPIETLTPQSPKPLANNESLTWNTFSLELQAIYQNYQAKALPALQFSLFAQAMACSPPLPVGKQKLTKISITSANDYSDKYPAGSELVDVFESINHGEIKLTSLLVNSSAPLQLRLKLIEAPQYARQNFEVQITLDDGSVYSLKTGDVYFTLP